MIEKLSPTLELALQNELRQAYLKGVETGRKMEREESDRIRRAESSEEKEGNPY